MPRLPADRMLQDMKAVLGGWVSRRIVGRKDVRKLMGLLADGLDEWISSMEENPIEKEA